ncbi:pentatricopeptide repeat-containing protein At5g48910-like isoform X1 [Dioscorea cayenensis subsp. rotundata]|uniref:Pentatricopeptide repeat-containing protein At5g48910-like isoform X1 n=1 Tax=Dioscorea cayennensis subsp. rotundata TaxID=55577 RepID=A0AB40BU89_DIOCR|nr:pentatricopeptide repeat-containing protein At5g48910-like isoform X1 [Dioscorea cayenensis subsp. rotundata]XP_039131019.1 pentatricopeptide repeat-containing protein At5g48910-like isoform X1 [Dioscorea cayenensis subsp. rotundata]XP_039131020.1 pentatricopeptide repeat-containing protein At5g48910-like isoform X1 [Dioscorea cayenensis subsp. rotundata]
MIHPQKLIKRFQWPTPSSLNQTTQLHAHFIISGAAIPHPLSYPSTAHLSSRIPNPSTFYYNTLIRAYSRFHLPHLSILIHRQMITNAVPHDSHTFQFLFKSCSLPSMSLLHGKVIHGLFLRLFPEFDALPLNSLIHLYVAFGCLDDARWVFDGIGMKDVVSWTTIVAGLARAGCLDDARKLFDEMPERNVVSWTSMVSGYSQAGRAAESVEFFKKMISDDVLPDTVAMVAVLSACGQLRDLGLSKWVHQYVIDAGIGMSDNLAVALIDVYAKCGDLNSARQVFDLNGWKVLPAWNALIDGYCKVGDVDMARSLFDQTEVRDLITFNSMICGYIQSSQLKQALHLFVELRTSGFQPDKFTMVGLLSACANLNSLDQGKALHAYIEVSSIVFDVFLGTALLDMYAKCGRMDEALLVFNRMRDKDVMTWTAVISGLAMNGKGKLALEHFALMRKLSIRPNAVAYIGVLTACSHSNLVEEARKHFHEMTSLYNLEPEVEHYGCMVDILGRGGLLEEAVKLIDSMPIKPNAVIWGSLLSACRVYKNVDVGEKAAKNILALEPNEDAVYVQLSNLYANSGNWASASKIRRLMEERGIKKTAGYSSLSVAGQVHKFIAGDRCHPEINEIEAMMNVMAKKLKLAGYLPITSKISVDVNEEEKEQALFLHSERIAIAYGLMRLGASLPIHITKNLRVCEDCHIAIKLIAKIWNRKIVVRDRSRFHHFSDGQCSCNDFW